MKKWFFILVGFLLFTGMVLSQDRMVKELNIPVLPGVSWWVGIVTYGELMPIRDGYQADLHNNYGNQVQPLLISDHGDLVWSEVPYRISRKNDTLQLLSGIASLQYRKAGTTLREAFMYASKTWFPPTGKMPDPLLFSVPQFNTWIELTYDQNQRDILKYASDILNNKFQPGVLMIDDNWQEDYGKWDFHPGRFPDAKAMMDSLHHMGFKVMLWICPFVSPDCDVFRDLESKGILLKDQDGKTAIIPWWNGYSGELDLSNPATSSWFKQQLDHLQNTYGVDGFKFDAGDFGFYSNTRSYGHVTPQEQCELYAKVGLDYPLNEYRANWKMAGQPLANRLRDKYHTWEDLRKLIPDILLQGIIGYNFTCPDMIGGGDFISFLPGNSMDQELIVRSAQCHALMPMMQFSVAPWRVLDSEHLGMVKKAVAQRKIFTPLIQRLTEESALTGEPIVRPLEYVFPHRGYAAIKDQFMLGDSILVAPVLQKGVTERKIILPPGKWKDRKGKIYRGNRTIVIPVSLDVLPFFSRLY
jgi:alpha-glucosidase